MAPTRWPWRPRRHREGESYVINGDKKWIGNGTIADVWPSGLGTPGERGKGFLVEKGTPGYNARVMGGKASPRAVWQAEITSTTYASLLRTGWRERTR